MTDKPMILKGLERIERYLSEAESSIDIARDYMQEVLDDIKINDEVSDFLLGLVASKDVPEEIRSKADELWKKI
jgi:hypothetical protein